MVRIGTRGGEVQQRKGQEARLGSSVRGRHLVDARWPVLTILILLLVSSAAAAQSGQSIGVTPPEHEIEHAIQGESYRRQVTVQNEFDSNTTISLATSGEVGDWTTTQPSSGFLVPPRTHASIDLTIAVPSDAVNGTYTGKLHITAEPKSQPDGSGAAIRYSVAVLLEVQVGGDPVHKVTFVGGGASDVEAGSTPVVETMVANQGNVRERVEVCASVVPFEGGAPVAQARRTVTVLPGERATISFSFDDALPLGQYVARVVPGCEGGEALELGDDASFKVVPPGTLGKDGLLRFLDHPPRAEVGRPVEIAGVFDNVGKVDVSRAVFTCRVYLDDALVHVIETEPRVVRQGDQAGLRGFFTPEEPGRYLLRGTVTYDGYETEERESFLIVQGETAAPGAADLLRDLAPYLIILGIVGGVGVHLWRRRRDDETSDPHEADGDEEELAWADVELLDR